MLNHQINFLFDKTGYIFELRNRRFEEVEIRELFKVSKNGKDK